MSAQQIIPVILSGGSGTRLWPVSRESFPKQLWPLISDHTLLQETALRARGDRFASPVVVCNQEHRFLIAEQLRAAGISSPRILLEPVGRNSAPAIAAAAVLVAEDDPDAVLWLLAADHVITDTAALHEQPCHRRRGGAHRTHRHLRHASDGAGDRLRLHRHRRGAGRCAGRLHGRGVRGEAGCREGGAPRDGRPAPVEFGHVRVHRADADRGDGNLRPRRAARGAPRSCRAADGSRFHPSRRRGVHRQPLDQPRLRGGRTHQPRRGRAGRYRLVRCRQLGRAVGAGREGCGRQRRGGRRAAGGRAQLLRPQRRHARRRGRPGGRRGRGHRGRRAGHAPRPRAGREEGGRSPEGVRPARGGGAQPPVSALGVLRDA